MADKTWLFDPHFPHHHHDMVPLRVEGHSPDGCHATDQRVLSAFRRRISRLVRLSAHRRTHSVTDLGTVALQDYA